VTGPRVRPSRRGTRRRSWVVPLVTFAALVVSFVVGIAVGEALHDNPKPGGSQTIVRTLDPLPLVPASGATVTVTVRKP
jgi:hypothetical protein